jgi:hypothetical protein
LHGVVPLVCGNDRSSFFVKEAWGNLLFRRKREGEKGRLFCLKLVAARSRRRRLPAVDNNLGALGSLRNAFVH